MDVLEANKQIPNGVLTENTFEELYELAFPLVAKFVSKSNGSFQEAKDIFHDALIIFYEKQVAGTIRIQVPAEIYLLGIAKHLWFRKFKQEKSYISFDELEQEISIPEDYFQENKENNRLLALLQISGRKCLQLLQAIYYDQLGLPDVATIFGYRTVRSATVQKYKCLEKVRDQVKEKSIRYEDLLEQ